TVPEQLTTFAEPIARGPVGLGAATTMIDDWEVSAQPSSGALTLQDQSALAKLEVRSKANGAVGKQLETNLGRVHQRDQGSRVDAAGRGQWHICADDGTQASVLAELQERTEASEELATVVYLTHGRALFRLSGTETPELLSKICALEFADDVIP